MRTPSSLATLTMLALATVVLAGCAQSSPKASSARSTDAGDTIAARSLARFRDTLGARPTALSNGAPSLDSLINAFGAAVSRRDTVLLRQLALSPAEYAYLYYPDSPMSRKPYELDADLMWMQISSRTNKGLTRLMRAYGGKPFHYVSHECTPAEHHGDNTMINACRILHVTPARDTVLEQLFGSIVERGGTYKLVGYANTL